MNTHSPLSTTPAEFQILRCPQKLKGFKYLPQNQRQWGLTKSPQEKDIVAGRSIVFPEN